MANIIHALKSLHGWGIMTLQGLTQPDEHPLTIAGRALSEYETQKRHILYFERGYVDASDDDDENQYQQVGIDIFTLGIADRDELIYESDLPDLTYGINDFNDVIDAFKRKKWRVI